MRYELLTSHDDIFAVPDLMVNDTPLFIGMTDLGNRWAYTIASGPYEADVLYFGDDLRGPEFGSVEPGNMAASLMGFLSAYAEGDMTRDGLYFDGDLVAGVEAGEFIVANGERFGIAASDIEQGYLAFSDDTFDYDNGVSAYAAEPTGKDYDE